VVKGMEQNKVDFSVTEDSIQDESLTSITSGLGRYPMSKEKEKMLPVVWLWICQGLV